MLRRGKRRFHWRLEQRADQRRAVGRLAALSALHVVVVGHRMENARQERARRQCLERLLWELDQMQIAQVWLDRRTESLNRRDREFVGTLRARGIIGKRLRVDFLHSFDGNDGEILLWLPDIVAGAVAAARGDGDVELRATLAGSLRELVIDLA